MLSLGSGSACDICLEAFGAGRKAASVIVCGHVFCSECIDKLRSGPSTNNHPDPNYNNARPTIRVAPGLMMNVEDAQTMQSLLERIINITNQGASEEESRQCTADVRTFLERQENSKQLIGLRACYKMLFYTIDIRVRNRQLRAQKAELEAQKTDLEASLNRVREEKAEVERKATDERNLALSIEKSLREQVKLAQDGYEAMIVVATDLSTICERLQHSYRDDSYRHDQSTRELASRITQRLASYHDEHVRRDEHVVAEPGNFMVSPLSVYSALPPRPFVLPEESEDEMPPPKPHNHDEDTLSYEITQASSSVDTSDSMSRPRGRGSISVDETAPLAELTPLATFSSSQIHSAPPHIFGSTSRSQRRESIPKDKTPVTATSESPSTYVFRNHMLQDLLQDMTPTGSGSSPQINVPSSSNQSPAVPRHDSHKADEKQGLGYYPLPQPSPSLLAERRELRQENLRESQARDTQTEETSISSLASVPSPLRHPSYKHAHAPVPTYDPSNVPISSASSAAKAKARERAEKAEREKRTEKDMDSIRKKAGREERHKAKRAETGYPEYESFASSYPGDRSSSSRNR
ncbi:hypothetical protein C0995_002783 [Termitomyces sp. Mi166|nr:hypothetical protein C0995_002783 [Termitomyces sp. Mi166\